MARVSRGAEITLVVPAGIYGPSLFPERALVPTIFTGTLMKAATGELTRYLRHRMVRPRPVSRLHRPPIGKLPIRRHLPIDSKVR